MFEFRWNSPLEIKGSISWSNGTLVVKARYLLGVTLFFAAWLAGWTVGGLMFLVKGQFIGIAFVLLGWLFAGGIIAISRHLELKRFDKLIEEVQTTLAANPAAGKGA